MTAPFVDIERPLWGIEPLVRNATLKTLDRLIGIRLAMQSWNTPKGVLVKESAKDVADDMSCSEQKVLDAWKALQRIGFLELISRTVKSVCVFRVHVERGGVPLDGMIGTRFEKLANGAAAAREKLKGKVSPISSSANAEKWIDSASHSANAAIQISANAEPSPSLVPSDSSFGASNCIVEAETTSGEEEHVGNHSERDRGQEGERSNASPGDTAGFRDRGPAGRSKRRTGGGAKKAITGGNAPRIPLDPHPGWAEELAGTIGEVICGAWPLAARAAVLRRYGEAERQKPPYVGVAHINVVMMHGRKAVEHWATERFKTHVRLYGDKPPVDDTPATDEEKRRAAELREKKRQEDEENERKRVEAEIAAGRLSREPEGFDNVLKQVKATTIDVVAVDEKPKAKRRYPQVTSRVLAGELTEEQGRAEIERLEALDAQRGAA